jgi:hypothetical protein
MDNLKAALRRFRLVGAIQPLTSVISRPPLSAPSPLHCRATIPAPACIIPIKWLLGPKPVLVPPHTTQVQVPCHIGTVQAQVVYTIQNTVQSLKFKAEARVFTQAPRPRPRNIPKAWVLNMDFNPTRTGHRPQLKT